jgi:ParB family chromosome partitioning protein
MEKKGLGRGLSALLADVAEIEVPQPGSGARSDHMVPIEKIRPNPNQPRKHFAEKDLQDLAASIREKGVLQPLILRNHGQNDGHFEIVAGERRWRAAQLAGAHEVPAILRDLSDTEVLELAIVENIQREDLNAVEEALAFRQLMDRFGHTQEKLAEALGKSRSHIANLLRLLNLPDVVLDMLRDGKISAGHARALVTASDPAGLARQVVERDLSVRQTEQLARAAAAPPRLAARAKDADTIALEADLSAVLRMKVSISHKLGKNSGELKIRYNSLDDLDGLCQMLSS